VVALGGGHGLAVVLRAVRTFASDITAIVSVADDGGSSGRLRRELDVPAPGDLRKCLVALAEPGNRWAEAFEHRFDGGDLDGHAFGNLVLVGLAEAFGDFTAAIDEAAGLLGAAGRVRPATTEPVVLKAHVDGGGVDDAVEGQVAVANAPGRIRRVEIVPSDAQAHPDAVAAIAAADVVVLAPGSLFTSLLPVLVVPELRDAIAATAAMVVQVCNLRRQVPETQELDGTDHLRAVLDHGGRVDYFVHEGGGSLACDADAITALGVRPIAAEVGDRPGTAHDPARLAKVLQDLLESG
jgi:uncharacterized cofD-like protein